MWSLALSQLIVCSQMPDMYCLLVFIVFLTYMPSCILHLF